MDGLKIEFLIQFFINYNYNFINLIYFGSLEVRAQIATKNII